MFRESNKQLDTSNNIHLTEIEVNRSDCAFLYALFLPIFVICVVFLTLNLHCQKCFIIPFSLTLVLCFLSSWTDTKRLLALGLAGRELPWSLLQLFQQKRHTDRRMRPSAARPRVKGDLRVPIITTRRSTGTTDNLRGAESVPRRRNAYRSSARELTSCVMSVSGFEGKRILTDVAF